MLMSINYLIDNTILLSFYLNVYVDNVTLNLIETKNNSKYLTGYLDKVIRPLVLILPKMSRYVKTFKVKDEDKH